MVWQSTLWIYAFGDGEAEGRAGKTNLQGEKGTDPVDMSKLGLPVPPGLTITTEVCSYHHGHGRSYPEELKFQVENAASRASRTGARLVNEEFLMRIIIPLGSDIAVSCEEGLLSV